MMKQPVLHAKLECERCGTVLQSCRCLAEHEAETVVRCNHCVRLTEWDAVIVKRQADRRKW